MFKTVLALTLLLLVDVLAGPLSKTTTTLYEDQRAPQQEMECAFQGGTCRLRKQCSSGDIVRLADLCPQQSYRGVVCCYNH